MQTSICESSYRNMNYGKCRNDRERERIVNRKIAIVLGCCYLPCIRKVAISRNISYTCLMILLSLTYIYYENFNCIIMLLFSQDYCLIHCAQKIVNEVAKSNLT